MSDKVIKFCDSVHEKLGSLEGRMDSLKLNIGTTWHSLQEKLGEVRHTDEARKQAVTQARDNLEQWFREKTAEKDSTIDRWIENREIQKLTAGPKIPRTVPGLPSRLPRRASTMPNVWSWRQSLPGVVPRLWRLADL